MSKNLMTIWLGCALAFFVGIPGARASNQLAQETESGVASSSHQDLFLKLFNVKGMKPEVFDLALKAHARAVSKKDTTSHVLAIVDYTLPSYEKRLWVVDLEKRRVILRDYVAHGRSANGGESLMADYFSNTPNSNASSLGAFVTGKLYQGKHGISMRIRGLEKDFNTNAEKRAIVLHQAPYVSKYFIQKNGRLGCSYGCFAVRPQAAKKLVKSLPEGTFLFAYYPDQTWLKKSAYLKD